MQPRFLFIPLLAVLSSPVLHAQQAELRAMTESSFDPDGPYDNGALLKDPHGPYTEDLQLEAAASDPAFTPGSRGPDGALAAPSNDSCSSATVIPGSTITYSPSTYSTTTATTEACESSESCGGIGTSNTVWYSYTPDQDGVMAIDTFGSSYDTVLSVFDRCGRLSGIFCLNAIELACNNDFGFGSTSQIYLNVTGGQTYLIKIGAAFGSGGGTLDFNLRYLPPNDNCTEPTDVFGDAYDPPLLSTHNAQSDVCEPNETCEFNGVGVSNSVWYRYTAPCDGLLDLNTNGSTYDTVLSIWDGCSVLTGGTNCNYPSQIACDDDSGTGTASQLIGLPVVAGTTYLIKVTDYNPTPGGGYLDFNLLFTGSAQPTADISSPLDFGAVCSTAFIQGTADASGGYVAWELDYRSTGTGTWTSLASSTTAITGGTLATWNTSALPGGYYLLRLTVSNACGTTESDTSVVWVDQGFSSLDLRAPVSGLVFGERVTVDGTAWDEYFARYTLDYRPAASSTYLPLDPSTPQYGSTVVNDPLLPGGWDTIGTGIPDGDYVVRLQGTDQCGHTEEETSSITIDNTPPTALITRPTQRQRLVGKVSVRGTASDAHLALWTLEVTGGGSNDWTLLAQSSTPITGGQLAGWNTNGLAPGPYTLRLTVQDSSILGCGRSNRSEYLVSVHVGKAAPVVE